MTVFRIAAVVLLFLTAGELLACAAAPATGCDPECADAAGSHCLCCCRHAVPATLPDLMPSRPVAFAVPPIEAPPARTGHPRVYHPPRS